MRKQTRIFIGITLLTLAVTLLFDNRKKKKEAELLAKVSDEGYETAQDVLFPAKSFKSKKLHFGPVLPV